MKRATAEEENDEGSVEEYVPVHKRRLMRVKKLKEQKQKARQQQGAADGGNNGGAGMSGTEGGAQVVVKSLLDQAIESGSVHAGKDPIDPDAALRAEEEEMMEAVTAFKPLISHQDLAKDVSYADSMVMTDWAPPSWTQQIPKEAWEAIRAKHHILMEGEEPLMPTLERFIDMRLPSWLLRALNAKGIEKPSPVQMQGIPVALSGRDMIGIAYTGSGKTLVFALPLFCYALSVERKFPVPARGGPLGVIICPSRELAEQSHHIILDWAEHGRKAGAPSIRSMLCIGGTSLRESMAEYDQRGVHVIVATPGRLLHLLRERMLTLNACRYLCLDEADRLIDLGFEEPVRDIMSFFPHQRQTLLFSATMPLKIAQFAKSALVRPVIVNVGRAGAAAMAVRQDIEYVQDDDRITRLLVTLQKTPPPVLVFAENQRDVDDIHEFLLMRNVEATSIHGGKSQAERSEAVRLFKEGQKDVLVSADVGAKGLDFPGVQHVINFDMPREIENYIHRIGRTGRGGKKGVATTFLGSSCLETILLDLRGVLEEAKQVVPEFLKRIQGQSLSEAMTTDNAKGCVYCGGLGHRIMDCPKLESERRKQMAGATMDMGGGM